jgi:hypothetical protein
MGWSRDLGVVGVGDDVEAKLVKATTTVTADAATETFVRTTQLSSTESHTLTLVAAMAKGALSVLGGKAHVHVGARCAIEPDGATTTSFTQTITVTTPRA